MIPFLKWGSIQRQCTVYLQPKAGEGSQDASVVECDCGYFRAWCPSLYPVTSLYWWDKLKQTPMTLIRHYRLKKDGFSGNWAGFQATCRHSACIIDVWNDLLTGRLPFVLMRGFIACALFSFAFGMWELTSVEAGLVTSVYVNLFKKVWEDLQWSLVFQSFELNCFSFLEWNRVYFKNILSFILASTHPLVK